MNFILYLLWPGCPWAAITKALSSGPQGPFTQWCNVCTHSPHSSPYQRPRPASLWPSGRLRLHHIVYSNTAYSLCTKARKRAKGVEVKTSVKETGMWCLGSWLLSIKGPPSLFLWRERRGWRVRVHSYLFVPWRGVNFGCGKKTGLSPCRHAGLSKLMWSWPNSKRQKALAKE